MGSHLNAYVEHLPHGLESYPGFLQKASVYRSLLESLDRRQLGPDTLPDAVRQLIVAPPPASTWIPEAHATAFYVAMADQCFDSDEAYIAHWLKVNRSLLSSPIYRFLMAVASPVQVIKGGARRWGALHKGVTLRIAVDGKSATLRLAFPENLLDRFVCTAYATAFQAALELSGGKGSSCALRAYEPTLATFEGRWD